MKQPPKCQLCKVRPALWAMQFIGDAAPSFYSLGWHMRGFSVTKVCDECRVNYTERKLICSVKKQ
jgi:hypothetical protein